MALTLTLRARERFYIDNAPWEVKALTCDGVDLLAPDGKVFHITNAKALEISPEVFVSEGEHRGPFDCYLCFRAPRRIAILRESLVGRTQE